MCVRSKELNPMPLLVHLFCIMLSAVERKEPCGVGRRLASGPGANNGADSQMTDIATKHLRLVKRHQKPRTVCSAKAK